MYKMEWQTPHNRFVIFMYMVILLLQSNPCFAGEAEASSTTTIPPRFLTHPKSQVIKQNGKVILECAATPNEATISWLYNGQILVSNPGSGIQIQGRKLHIHSFRHTKRDRGDTHEGIYSCVASNQAGVVISQAAILQRAFMGQFSDSLPDEDINATQGNTALIPCHPPRGTPSPVVSFEVDGRPLDLSSRRHMVMPSGNLQIFDVKQSDEGVYRCVGENSVSGQRRVAHNQVNFKVISPTTNTPPRFIQEPQTEYEVILGQNLTLECVVQGSPVPHILWNKHEGELPKGRSRQVWGNLIIHDVQVLDQGEYICRAENGVGQPAADVANVRVIEPPSIRIPPANQIALVGTSVTFRCVARGRNVRTEWIYNGQPTFTQDNIEVTDSSLTITRVTKQQSGVYQCTAQSDLGHVTESAYLQVKDQAEIDYSWPVIPDSVEVPGMDSESIDSSVPRPVISVGPTNTTAEVGGSIELPCRAQLSSQGTDDDSFAIPRYTEDQARIRYYWFHYGVKNESGDEQNGGDQDGGHSGISSQENVDVNGENQNGDDSDGGNAQDGAVQTQNGDVIDDSDENRDVINSGADMVAGRLAMTENGSLLINDLQSHDRGQFVCVAANAGGNAIASAYVEVIDSNPTPPPDNTPPDDDMGPGGRRSRPRDNDEDADTREYDDNLVPPSAPEVTQSSETTARVRWAMPTLSDGGPTISLFKIQYRDITGQTRDDRQWRTMDVDVPPTHRQIDVPRLNPGSTYKFRVFAVYTNDSRPSENSRKFELTGHPVRPASPSTQPIIVELRSLGIDNLAMRWQYLSQDISPIEGFNIYIQPYGTDEPPQKHTVVGGDTRRYSIRGLEPNMHYSVVIRSYNGAGEGPVSQNVVEKTLVAPGSGGHDVPTTRPSFVPEERLLTTPRRTYGGGYLDDDNSTANSNQMLYMGLGVFLGIMLFILLLLMLFCWWKQRKHRRRMESADDHAKFGDPSKTIYADSLRKQQLNGGTQFLLSDLNGMHSNGGIRNGSIGNGHVILPPANGNGGLTMTQNPMSEYDEAHPGLPEGEFKPEQDFERLRASLHQAFHPPGAPPAPPERGVPNYPYTAAEYARHPHNYFEVDPNSDTMPHVHMTSFGCPDCKYGSRPQSRNDSPYNNPYGGPSNQPPPEYNSLNIRHPHSHHRLSGGDYPDYSGSLRRPKTNPHVGYDSGYRASPDHIPRSHERPYRAAPYDPHARSTLGTGKLYDPYNGSSQDTAYGSHDQSGNMSDVYEQLGSEKSYSSGSQLSGRPKHRSRKSSKGVVMGKMDPSSHTESGATESPLARLPSADSPAPRNAPPQLPPRNTPPVLTSIAPVNQMRQTPPLFNKEKPVPASRNKLLPRQASNSSSGDGHGSLNGLMDVPPAGVSDNFHGQLDAPYSSGAEHSSANDNASMSPQVSLSTDPRALESDLDIEQINVSDNEGVFTGAENMTDSHISSSVVDEGEEEEEDDAIAVMKPLFSTPAVNKLNGAPLVPRLGSPLASPIMSPRLLGSPESQPLMTHPNIPRVNDYPSDDENDS